MDNYTKGIGFKNFRRFQNFPMLHLGPITYMVGRNNSGKSTMVKALLLIMDYLQNQLADTFSFDNVVLEDANIVTFGRAKNNTSSEPSIIFNINLNNYQVEISLSGNDENTKANVDYLKVTDNATGFTLNIDHNKEEVNIAKNVNTAHEEVNIDSEREKLKTEIDKIALQLDHLKSKTSKEGLLLSDALNKLKDRLKKIGETHKEKETEDTFEYNLSYSLNFQESNKDDNDSGEDTPRTEDNELKEIVSTFIYHNNLEYRKIIEERKTVSDNEDNQDIRSNIEELYKNNEGLEKWIDAFVDNIDKELFYFIAANPSKQSALFYLRDKYNALAQAIHNFYQLGIQEGQEEHNFVIKWMKAFEVGDKFKIHFFAGEAYEFKVVKQEETWLSEIRFSPNPEHKLLKDGVETHLSDMGMGSLQAMTLILKIASLIRLNKKNKKHITILIEEPELNLHPALQSKLTDFFHEVHYEYGFNFIVETHSEYIIRRSQLLALENDYLSNQDLNPNPFSIFYFHKDEGPYKMEYNDQGKFNRDFGPGFYDEAGSMTLKMIKELRKNQTK